MKNNRRVNITFAEAMQMLINDNKIILIDVKSKKEYDDFHLGNSINIPIENFKYMVSRILKNKNQKIIVYCSTGVRSLAACEILIDMGFKYVYNIDGGIS